MGLNVPKNVMGRVDLTALAHTLKPAHMVYFIISANFARKRDPAIYDISSVTCGTSQRTGFFVFFSPSLTAFTSYRRNIIDSGVSSRQKDC